MLLPIGLEDSSVNRLPWATIAIAAVCVVAFFATWVLPSQRRDDVQAQYREVARYWALHPGVKAPERLVALVGDRAPAETTPATATAEEQQQFDQLAGALIAAIDHQPMRRYALVPARGLRQPGWLTHMFLHFGWMHLLGNFLFLYLVGPFLEDVWGRPVYSAFYLTGGLVAALAQYAAERHSIAAMAGASGAIAACMGAFMFRFAKRRIRMAYFFWVGFRPLVGTFFMRAWLFGLLWFGSEVLSLLLGGLHGSGVAVMAHIGGFIFGAAFAFGLGVSGVERKHLTPAVERTHEGWTQHPAIERAHHELSTGNRDAARKAFQEALGAEPTNREARLGLVRLDLESGQVDAGMRRLELALGADLSRNDAAAVRLAIDDLGPLFHPAALRPATAYRVAQALEQDGHATLAESTFVAAAAVGGALGAKALLRAAELRFQSHTDVAIALGYLDALRALEGVPAEAAQRAAELRRAVEVHDVAGGGRGIELQGEPAPPSPLTVRRCRLVGLSPQALELEDEKHQRTTVLLRSVLGVAVGVIPAPEEGRNVVLTDLVLNWGDRSRGPSVVRLPGGALGLQTLFPQAAPKDAFGRFLMHVLEASGATGLPDRDGLVRGSYARYANLEAFEAAIYAPA